MPCPRSWYLPPFKGQVLVRRMCLVGDIKSVSSCDDGVSGSSEAYLANASGAGVLGTGVSKAQDHSKSFSSSSWPCSGGVRIHSVLSLRFFGVLGGPDVLLVLATIVPFKLAMALGSILFRRLAPPRGMIDVSRLYGASSSHLFSRSQLLS